MKNGPGQGWHSRWTEQHIGKNDCQSLCDEEEHQGDFDWKNEVNGQVGNGGEVKQDIEGTRWRVPCR